MNEQHENKSLYIILTGMLIVVIFLVMKVLRLEGSLSLPSFSLEQSSGSINLWIVLLTGLTVGGLTCLAVQGGLLASVIAAKEESEIERGVNRRNTILPTLAFLFAKLVAYTVLGFMLGAFGGAIGISQTAQIIMQFIAGVYMIVVALNLLEIHPIFRYVLIQPPKFLTRRIRSTSKSKELFAPAVVGAMTVFIPCGTTLAMEALAISSANAFMGAAIMATFVLGTTPLFFGVGWVTSVLGDNFRKKFLKVAALAVIYLGITSIYGSLIASGVPISIQLSRDTDASDTAQVRVVDGVQQIDLTINTYGYTPNNITVKQGQPVKINLKSTDAYSCASAFRIPSLGVIKNLQPNGSDSVEFTPKEKGEILFTCSMGMYRGVIEVI